MSVKRIAGDGVLLRVASSQVQLDALLAEVRACQHCAEHLPHAPRPVLRAASSARILVAGQAPGRRVHASGIPWDDASGKRLRSWLDLTPEQFYDQQLVAIIPMGFCYPGSGASGDLPPRPECSRLWHEGLFRLLPNIKLKLIIGSYAQKYHLQPQQNLTETVRNWRAYAPDYFPLPHPSPRNQFWLRKNPWFEDELLPELREAVRGLVDSE